MDEYQHVENIMLALEHARPAKAPDALVERMQLRAKRFISGKISRFSRPVLLGIAASLLLLISLNVIMINNRMKANLPSAEIQMNEGYNLIPAKSIYYE